MTNAEHVDKLDQLIKEFERAQVGVEKANTHMNEVSQKLGNLLGITTKNLPEIKDEAHRKIGQLLLAERRSN